ncbi:MAG: hypothetical protein NC203_09730 [Firmicutes bacterium]|nr:hypothetical protein [[Eubacterium] siraeum]MCM1488635.1 hypothetical protein [Bacillota bacterium]
MPIKKENPLYKRGQYTIGQKISTKKYNEAHYDNINFRVKKGQKERLKEIAKKWNMTLNSFIFECIKGYLRSNDPISFDYLNNDEKGNGKIE